MHKHILKYVQKLGRGKGQGRESSVERQQGKMEKMYHFHMEGNETEEAVEKNI